MKYNPAGVKCHVREEESYIRCVCVCYTLFTLVTIQTRTIWSNEQQASRPACGTYSERKKRIIENPRLEKLTKWEEIVWQKILAI